MRLRRALLALSMGLMILTAAHAVAEDRGAQGAAPPPESGKVDRGLLALGAGLAIGLAGLGTGIAQSRIGAAGVGAVAEKPESLGVVIILLAIPETVVILGFVVASIILFM
jgi:V/A-type H+-transporting ATPase subunit K